MQALIDLNIIGDFRQPNLMRFGINPLFNSEDDINLTIEMINKVSKDRLWAKPEYNVKNFVT